MGRELLSQIRAGLLPVGISLVLAACGGGGGGGDAAAPATQNAAGPVVLGGLVIDGPIVSATVSVFDANGDLVEQAFTNGAANYEVAFIDSDPVFPITVRVTGGTNLVTGAPLAGELVAVIPTESAEISGNVSLFSTFAAGIAERMPGGINAFNLQIAEQTVIDQLSFGLDPADVQMLLSGPVADADLVRVVKASEAFAEMLRRTTGTLMSVGQVSSIDEVMAALQADLVDGVIDGRGAAGANARIAAVSTVTSAQVMLEAMTNTLTVDGVPGSSAMDAAIQQVMTIPDTSITVNDVAVTDSALQQLADAVAAAITVDNDPVLATLYDRLGQVLAPASPSLLGAYLPANGSSALGDTISFLGTASQEDLDQVNGVPSNTPGNQPPTISGNAPAQVTVGNNYSFTPTASDPDGDTLSFSIVGRPSWANFNGFTGRLSGTPGAADVGTYNNIRITVSDGIDSVFLAPFGITVNGAPNQPPTISGNAPTQVTVGNNYSFTPTAADPDGDALTFTISGRPAWASFDGNTGELSGTPDAGDAGTFNNIQITVSDGEDSATLPPFSITVNEIPNQPPVISGTPPTQVTVGNNYSFTPTASDPDGDALTFSIVNRPSWATFSSSTGQLSGTPSAGDVGTTNNVRIRVTDGSDTRALPFFSVTVNPVPNQPPVISGSPPSQVTEGTAYSFTPTASDPDGDALTFSIAGRPSWASFNSNSGTLSGTPGAGDVGTFSNIRITVSDGEDSTTLSPFAITVIAAPNQPPTISGTPANQVTVGFQYSFRPTASDPDGDPLTFSITNRPSWGIFNSGTGRLRGTPTANEVGTYANIVISVTDGEDSASLPAFSITVGEAPNQPPTISGNPSTQVTEGNAYSFTPTASDPDGDNLTFSISGLPSWASFNNSTGQLSGTPGAGDVGTYNNIVISVSDGEDSAQLAAFSIVVSGAPSGGFTVMWDAPTTNTDGSLLTDLAGYRVYLGNQSGNYTTTIDVNNPNQTSYVFDSLAPGTYFVAVRAFDTSGNNSAFSDEASTTL